MVSSTVAGMWERLNSVSWDVIGMKEGNRSMITEELFLVGTPLGVFDMLTSDATLPDSPL
jgi:hypothetical protein